MKSKVLSLVVVILIAGQAAGQSRSIHPEQSTLTVRVYKSGLFSALAHDHEIAAPILNGRFDESALAVELAVDARKLRVVDKEVSEKDRAEIQETMLGPKVLDSERFPEIRFRSTKITRLGGGKWQVEGELTLHGQAHATTVQVEGSGGHYKGFATVPQKDFGIEPIRIAGGTVKVKNEVRIEFEIVGQ